MIQYCTKGKGKYSRCSEIALFKVFLINKTSGKIKIQYRCEKHKLSRTSNFVYKSSENIEQPNTEIINKILNSFKNKEIISNFHNKKLIVRFLKHNGSVMCQDKNNKWYCVYYNQINGIKHFLKSTEILENNL